ncbi:MAG: aldo/keto reductase [Evtepia sp.]
MTQQAHLSDAFSLANGVAIPCLGYGTWRMQDGAETVAAIQTALSLGYRHIDTAAYYRNEASVGQALRASGLPREAVFLTSKVWNTDRGYAPTKAAFQATLDRLGTDYPIYSSTGPLPPTSSTIGRPSTGTPGGP